MKLGAACEPAWLCATLSAPVRVLDSLPRLLSGGKAFMLAWVSELFLRSPIRLPTMLLAPPRDGAYPPMPPAILRWEGAPAKLCAALLEAKVSMLALSAGNPDGVGLL